MSDRYRYCGGTTIKDNREDSWAHDIQSFADRLNDQQKRIDQLERENERLQHELEHGAKLVQDLGRENAELKAANATNLAMLDANALECSFCKLRCLIDVVSYYEDIENYYNHTPPATDKYKRTTAVPPRLMRLKAGQALTKLKEN